MRLLSVQDALLFRFRLIIPAFSISLYLTKSQATPDYGTERIQIRTGT